MLLTVVAWGLVVGELIVVDPAVTLFPPPTEVLIAPVVVAGILVGLVLVTPVLIVVAWALVVGALIVVP